MTNDTADGTTEGLIVTRPAQIFKIENNNAQSTDRGWPNSGSSINITFHNISYSVSTKITAKRKKEILRGVSGYFRGGCLNAIIGPSGAGKTSLLDALCGLKYKNNGVTGHFKINGTYVTPGILRKFACYIPQEFELLPNLTTRETLYFAVKLKVPGVTKNRLHEIINEVANRLGLLHCLGTMTGNLSGGERRRLSIGIEIVVNPTLLVLDEPTSGLDSAASIQLVNLLKNIAETGCTVVCSIHQPSSQMMMVFDEVLILAGGRDIYCGPRSEIVRTLEEVGFCCPSFYNISEYVIEVVTGQHGGNLELLKKCSRKFQLTSADSSALLLCTEKEDIRNSKWKSTGIYVKDCSYKWWNEFQVLTWRGVKCVARDNTLTKLRLAAHVAVGTFLGIVFYNFGDEGSKVFSNISALFFFLFFLFFANAMPAVQMFPTEAAVFKREHSNQWYSLSAYYLSKVITDVPLQILCSTCFLAISYSMTGQPMEGERFMKTWLIGFLMSVLAQSFGILTGAALNTHLGMFLVPALNIPMSIFAGFFLKLGEIPAYLSPLSFISYFRYAFEGIVHAVYAGNRGRLRCSEKFCIFNSSKKVLEFLDMPSIEFSTAVYALIGWITFLHGLIYIVLRWKFIWISK